MAISVVIPTYGRPSDLLRCLRALERQEAPAREVIVVCRHHDTPTQRALEALESSLPLRVELVDAERQSVAMNAGVAVATSPVVALTDDDAVPRPGWIAGLQSLHALPGVGAVGGRDLVHTPEGTLDQQVTEVGVVKWYGRRVGNHHLGAGAARNVDFLKGVNLSVRRELWMLDERLQGVGIQMHWELDVSLAVRRSGLQVIYDPGLIVDHHPAARIGNLDQRAHRASAAVRHEAHNQTLALLKWLPLSRALMTLGYDVAVGSSATPGLVRSVVAVVRREPGVARFLLAALAGCSHAVATVLRTGRDGSRSQGLWCRTRCHPRP
jgi:GT2 family glycosyltransferase